MITIPSLSDVTDILDTDLVMVTNAQGQSYKIAGSELNKRGKIIIANSTTITGAPLKAGVPVRVYFTVDLTAANASTVLQLNYNGVNYYVKAPKDGTLINFVATNLGGSPAVYKYLQKYTTLELLFDGTQFVIIGNPVILSSADYTIYADGLQRVDAVINNDKNMVTSGAVARNLAKYISKNSIPYISLTNGQNINNLRTEGIYQGGYDAIGNSLIGRPDDGNIYACWLFVFKNINDTVIQILIASNGNIYYRVAYSLIADFNDWRKINTTGVIPIT